jgi:hypothetical protein
MRNEQANEGNRADMGYTSGSQPDTGGEHRKSDFGHGNSAAMGQGIAKRELI